MRKLPRICIAALAILLFTALAAYPAIIYLKKFDFNDDNALKKWGRMILNGQVKYLLIKAGADGYVEALSEKTCSALYYRIGFKLRDYPILAWRWKVLKFPDKSNTRDEKARDDYAARVYVIFPFLSFSSSKFIEYVWSEDVPVGSVMKSPNGDNIRLIVVRNGREGAGQWFFESRNVYDDYLKAFGKPPGLNVGAVAIMCDADGTGSVAEALFDDITIGNEAGTRRLAKNE